jgi:hypothetical protein
MSTMTPRLVVPLATIAVLAAGLQTGADAASERRGSVTRAEYRSVEAGMTRGRVERIFGAGGGCAYVTYAVGDVRYVNRQYRQADGLWTAVQFDSSVDGRLRVRETRPFKQWDLPARLCD